MLDLIKFKMADYRPYLIAVCLISGKPIRFSLFSVGLPEKDLLQVVTTKSYDETLLVYS